jgi:GMP synthase-like glutamine amidotransferase
LVVATNPRALVVQNHPSDDPRLLGEWLVQAGLDLDVVRLYDGAALPGELTGYAAFVVLGGAQSVVAGAPREPWFDRLESLLRKAVRDGLPTLAVCLGAQLLAAATGGTVEVSEAGPELGPALVAKRDVAEKDPLFGLTPMLPDVVQWHFDEVTELPLGAVLLATTGGRPVQAFRVGERAWGVQFHPEADAAMVAAWARADALALAELGLTPDDVVAATQELEDDLFEVWQPFATRFAALARGELPSTAQTLPTTAQTPEPGPGRQLPLLGH